MLRVLTFSAMVMATALPAAADKLSLEQVSKYLNSMRTAQGQFTQINDDGTISTGTIYIKRPGRVRFEYDPPNDALVMSGQGLVAIFDARSNLGPDTYSLNKTPLSIILADNVDLERERMVVGHQSDGTATTVTAQDPDHPEYGNIQLVFTANPTELRQWKINDDGGGTTTVVLGDLETGVRVKNIKFDIQHEANRRSSINR